MSNRLYSTLIIASVLVLSSDVVPTDAQQPSGGGSIVRDIGGAELIFRSPDNPALHDTSAAGRGSVGGGKVTDRRTPRTPPPRAQDQILAKGNAARSAAKPRYAEAEQQYQLAAKIAPDDARLFPVWAIFNLVRGGLRKE